MSFPEVFLEKIRLGLVSCEMAEKILSSGEPNEKKIQDAIRLAELLSKRLEELEVNLPINVRGAVSFHEQDRALAILDALFEQAKYELVEKYNYVTDGDVSASNWRSLI